MPINMSYCRFENTLLALQECSVAISDAGSFDNLLTELNEDEAIFARRLLLLCQQMSEHI
ncbi:MAG: hypothetical protein KGM99_15395 [Burkholderiales bacterium]|nr:hypothetical protein [Burkholderiales bacterium]